ncbi:MAG: response regulator [Candidatus Kuenenia sp.]|nr:response regulator [Candidatus Kuenenia hertensis]
MNTIVMDKKVDLANILVIDDEIGIRESLRIIFLDTYEVHLAANIEEATRFLKKINIDIVFLDIKMAHENGLDFLKTIKAAYPTIPVVIITAFPSSQTAITALRNGAFDYIIKPFDYSEILATTKRALNQRANDADKESMIYSLRKAVHQNFFSTTEALLHAIDAKDSYTAGHSKRVSFLIAFISERLGMNTLQIETLRYGAFLHDIGKIGISDYVLTKPGPLTDEEFEMIKRHPDIGYKILEPINFLKDSLSIVRHHHEWYSGNGYPDGLKGDEIPFEAMILSVVDAYDALTTDRQYRKKYSHKKALEIISSKINVQYAPTITEKILNIIDKYH